MHCKNLAISEGQNVGESRNITKFFFSWNDNEKKLFVQRKELKRSVIHF